MLMSKRIAEQYGDEYIFRQLAEEASELCQASLKMVRAMRGETPVTITEARNRVLEESADVEVMLRVLKNGILTSEENATIVSIFNRKRDRMIDRMIEGECLDSNGR